MYVPCGGVSRIVGLEACYTAIPAASGAFRVDRRSGGLLTSRSRRMVALRQAATTLIPDVAKCAAMLAAIPAPTGDEFARAARVADLFRDRNLPVEVADNGNVFTAFGTGQGRKIMLAAHTDTVFPAATPLAIVSEGGRLYGPGVGDNSLGVAAMVALVDLLRASNLELPVQLILVATVGEEGLGNLAGARAAVDRYGAELGAFIAVEGHNLGRVTCAGVGSLRWRVSVDGQGGHSWGAYGRPNAIHGLSKIIAAVSDIEPPSNPKTTFNVGVIEGGVSVNTIAPHASALFDIRSADAGSLKRFSERIRGTIHNTDVNGLTVTIETLGERPAGATPKTSPLVEAATSALRELGYEPTFDASSTDANVAMSRGIPAVCIGISRGGNGHTVEEYIDLQPIADGLTQLALLVLDTATALHRAAE